MLRPKKPLNPTTPAMFVAVALVAVAFIPIVIERRLSELRNEAAEMSDPVRQSVLEIQLSLALETAGTRGYLLTGDSVFAGKHHEARGRRAAAVKRLFILSRDFPKESELRDLTLLLTRQLAPADALLDSLYGRQITQAQYIERLQLQQGRLEAVTNTTRRLGISISESAAVHFTEMHQTQVTGIIATALLAIVAGLAALMIVRLGKAYRSLAALETAARAETEAARAEAEHRRAEAERIAESRARLVRGFTHDVKNPLSAASAHLNLVEMGVEDVEAALPLVSRAVNSAFDLVDELLSVAQAEAGEIVIRKSNVDLAELLKRSADDIYGLAKSKALWLQLEIPADLPAVVTDGGRVAQIVDNLLSNAVKYTHSGGVTAEVRVEPNEVDGLTAHITVTDTGPGLSSEDCALLFQEFRRLGTSAGTQGSGLGLAISRRIARALGGDITVYTEQGNGCTFELFFPCQQVATPESAIN